VQIKDIYMSNKKLILLFVTIVLLCFPAITIQAIENSDSPSTPSGIPLSELEQFIDEFMNEFIGTSVAGASVVIIENESIFYHGSFGYADMEAGVLVDADTVFEWGSAGKLLVWVSAMQLAEQGRLNLDSDIREYLPEDFLRRLQFDTPITMYHLMNHNAGWGVRTTDLIVFSSDDVVSLDEALRRFEPKQFFEPGTIVAYSNYGVAVAGYIIERITGQPFYEYVRENIFMPLVMNYTTAHP
jgi:CubicO group peptidase (beta-lactamase class C family)